MRTGIALGFICLGAILAFAVTGNTSVFNIHTAGWVIMLVGLVGLFLPRRNRAWLGRRVVVRRTRSYPSDVGPVEEIPVPPYVARNPGTSRIEAGLPARPTLMTERQQEMDDPIGNAENQAATQPTTATQRTAPQTEIIEDLYENPE